MAKQNSTEQLYHEILVSLQAGKELGKIIPSVLMIAKRLGNTELSKWAELEMNGYYNTTSALTDEDIVPEYRAVPGQYLDNYDRPLIISDPGLIFVNQYRLRPSISELEKIAGQQELVTIKDIGMLNLIKENFNFNATSFYFTSTSVIGVLDSIRTNIINKIMELEQTIQKSSDSSESKGEQTNIPHSIATLHKLIHPVAAELYANSHYRQAILDTYILLIETVKTKSGRYDLDGTALMQTVFSPKKPIIKISDDMDEQQGFMWMFSGAVMGIRNPKAHRLIPQTDPQRTLEWLSFASVLLRVLDDAQVIKD